MSARRPPRAEFIRTARAEGWRYVRHTGSGHIMLRHRSGATATIAATPSGGRSDANEWALLKRLARKRYEGRRA